MQKRVNYCLLISKGKTFQWAQLALSFCDRAPTLIFAGWFG